MIRYIDFLFYWQRDGTVVWYPSCGVDSRLTQVAAFCPKTCNISRLPKDWNKHRRKVLSSVSLQHYFQEVFCIWILVLYKENLQCMLSNYCLAFALGSLCAQWVKASIESINHQSDFSLEVLRLRSVVFRVSSCYFICGFWTTFIQRLSYFSNYTFVQLKYCLISCYNFFA